MSKKRTIKVDTVNLWNLYPKLMDELDDILMGLVYDEVDMDEMPSDVELEIKLTFDTIPIKDWHEEQD